MTADIIIERLSALYPDAHCELDYTTPYELLVAVILSAQCTDKRVNIVTKELFKHANTPQKMLELGSSRLEELIRSCGFFRAKAAAIISTSADILAKYGGNVPDTFEQLLSLKGVGRKTANVMMSVAFNEPAIAVDTHVFRLSHRLNLSEGKTPYDVEKDLSALLADEQKSLFHHLLIFHGRYCCKAQKPLCGKCNLIDICVSGDKNV